MKPGPPWEGALRRIEGILERAEALQWALSAGSRRGRTAKQFIDDLAGRLGVRHP